MDVSTDLSILISDSEWAKALEGMPEKLADSGFAAVDITSQIVSSACEPDNVLVSEYMSKHDGVPVVENVYRVIVNGSTNLPLHKATIAVVDCLPEATIWQGTSEIGHTEFGLGASPDWSAT